MGFLVQLLGYYMGTVWTAHHIIASFTHIYTHDFFLSPLVYNLAVNQKSKLYVYL